MGRSSALKISLEQISTPLLLPMLAKIAHKSQMRTKKLLNNAPTTAAQIDMAIGKLV